MPYIKYRLILEKYLMSDDESEDEHKVLYKYPPIRVSATFIKDSYTDNYKYRKILREDMYRKIDDMCISLEEQELMANEETVYAKWEKFDDTDDGHPAYYCSNCHAVLEDYMYQWNNFYHCHHCGAKMDNPFPCVPLQIKGKE